MNISEIKIKINKNNFFKLESILLDIVNRNIKKVDFEIVGSIPIEEIGKKLSSLRYRFSDKLVTRIKNLPYCQIKQPEGVIYFTGKKNNFTKPPKCEKCKYSKRCYGILKKLLKVSNLSKLKPILDMPREIMIEIEPRCNLNCNFCFNKNSFARRERNIENKLTKNIIKKITNNAKKNSIPRIRFTGGEPLLREDIWEIARYIKEKKLELRLNTNGVLIDNFNIAKKIAGVFDNILLPIQYPDVLKDNSVANKKIRAIKMLSKANAKIIRIGVVATREVIDNLEKVNKFINSLPIDKWEIYRVISTPQKKKSFSKKNVKDLVEGLLRIKNKPGKPVLLINAIPFCSYDPIKIQQVAPGADAVDGHERFAVDPRGFAKPIYYMRENIGDPTNILSCWNHPFMKKMRNLKFVPTECKKCVFLERCRGGCRFSAYISNGRYNSPDPLMNRNNIIYR